MIRETLFGLAMIKVNAPVAELFAVSLTVSEKLNVPAAFGVPVIAPPLRSERPAGSVPEVLAQEYCPLPPFAKSGCEYAVPVKPAGSCDGLEIV